jgi:hypothetical protein
LQFLSLLTCYDSARHRERLKIVSRLAIYCDGLLAQGFLNSRLAWSLGSSRWRGYERYGREPHPPIFYRIVWHCSGSYWTLKLGAARSLARLRNMLQTALHGFKAGPLHISYFIPRSPDRYRYRFSLDSDSARQSLDLDCELRARFSIRLHILAADKKARGQYLSIDG